MSADQMRVLTNSVCQSRSSFSWRIRAIAVLPQDEPAETMAVPPADEHSTDDTESIRTSTTTSASLAPYNEFTESLPNAQDATTHELVKGLRAIMDTRRSVLGHRLALPVGRGMLLEPHYS